jgi:hypothetical protein
VAPFCLIAEANTDHDCLVHARVHVSVLFVPDGMRDLLETGVARTCHVGEGHATRE